MKAYIKFPNKEGYFAELVDIIRKDRKLTHEQWWKYYTADPIVKLTAVKHSRLVFKKPDGGYVIIPDIPRNNSYWRN